MRFLLLGCAAALGCTATEHPPTTWPEDGCDAAGSAQERSQRWSGALVMDDGVALAVTMREPRGGCSGAVVIIPGGLQSGLPLLETDQSDALVDAGLTVVAFDPRGRGDSEGAEDANGPTGQDDLAALSAPTDGAVHPDVDAVPRHSELAGQPLLSLGVPVVSA